ncbi:MAG: hypothetical protein IT578_07895, partial [Verrucomicrobiae bacterium]|nr:hypothetical protein [Verrucomicrobiae bacterium]
MGTAFELAPAARGEFLEQLVHLLRLARGLVHVDPVAGQHREVALHRFGKKHARALHVPAEHAGEVFHALDVAVDVRGIRAELGEFREDGQPLFLENGRGLLELLGEGLQPLTVSIGELAGLGERGIELGDLLLRLGKLADGVFGLPQGQDQKAEARGKHANGTIRGAHGRAEDGNLLCESENFGTRLEPEACAPESSLHPAKLLLKLLVRLVGGFRGRDLAPQSPLGFLERPQFGDRGD